MGHEVGGPAVPHDMGTEAKILQADEYQDGRYDLLVLGGRRFHIQDLHRGKSYLEGKVEWVEEPKEDPVVLMRLRKAVEAKLNKYVDIAGASILHSFQSLLPMADSDHASVSYLLAQILPANAVKQQKMLEAQTVEERLEMEIDVLNSLILDFTSKRQLGH